MVSLRHTPARAGDPRSVGTPRAGFTLIELLVVIAVKPAYQQALAGVTITATNPDPDWSSSAMLYLALTQGRRGMAAFNPETLVEPTAIQTRSFGGKNFQIFVDAYGNPLHYFIF